MIQRIQSDAVLAQWLESASHDDCFAVQMRAAAQCFGTKDLWCSFYCADHALLMVQGASAVLWGEQCDWNELCDFCRLLGVVSLWACKPAVQARACAVMLHSGSISVTSRCEKAVQPSPCLWQLSQSGLIQGDAQAYYGAAVRMVRANTAKICTIEHNERPISTAGAYAVTSQAAYISVVATLPEYRRRGYAGTLVAWLCTELAPRQLLLICRPQEQLFYEELGFQQAGLVYECVGFEQDRR